jgi:hypothetical protein
MFSREALIYIHHARGQRQRGIDFRNPKERPFSEEMMDSAYETRKNETIVRN